MDLGLVGRAAAAATDLPGRCLIAGLLRTAVRGLRRALSPTFPGWRDGVLYPLAGGRRRLWRGASRPARAAWVVQRLLADSFLAGSGRRWRSGGRRQRGGCRLGLVGAAAGELAGVDNRIAKFRSTETSLRRALSRHFRAGEMVFFIPWRVVAEGSGAAHLDLLGPPGWCSGCWPIAF